MPRSSVSPVKKKKKNLCNGQFMVQGHFQMHFHPPVSNGGESHEKYGSRHSALLDRKSGVTTWCNGWTRCSSRTTFKERLSIKHHSMHTPGLKSRVEGSRRWRIDTIPVYKSWEEANYVSDTRIRRRHQRRCRRWIMVKDEFLYRRAKTVQSGIQKL